MRLADSANASLWFHFVGTSLATVQLVVSPFSRQGSPRNPTDPRPASKQGHSKRLTLLVWRTGSQHPHRPLARWVSCEGFGHRVMLRVLHPAPQRTALSGDCGL